MTVSYTIDSTDLNALLSGLFGSLEGLAEETELV